MTNHAETIGAIKAILAANISDAQKLKEIQAEIKRLDKCTQINFQTIK